VPGARSPGTDDNRLVLCWSYDASDAWIYLEASVLEARARFQRLARRSQKSIQAPAILKKWEFGREKEDE
jgi:hypothetical protein